MLDPFLSQIVTETRALALSYWARGFAVETKADRTLVTEADKAIEALFRTRLAQTYPDDGVYGEEHGHARLDARRIWVIDPIDGTQAFVLGIPVFSTLIALLEDGVVTQAVVDFSALDQRYTAAKGQGAWLGGQRLCVCAAPLHQACLTATSATMFAGQGAGFERLMGQVGSVRFGLDAYGFALLAKGRLQVAVEACLKPFDYLAPSLIVSESGGLMTDWQGGTLGLGSDGRVIAAADTTLHSAVQDLLTQG